MKVPVPQREGGGMQNECMEVGAVCSHDPRSSAVAGLERCHQLDKPLEAVLTGF